MVYICTIEYNSHQPHVVIEPTSMVGITEKLDINFILINLSSHMWLTPTLLISTALDFPSNDTARAELVANES